MECSLTDQALFLPVNGGQRSAHLLGAAGLDLGKDERLPVAADKIDLTPLGSPKIPTEDLPATTSQMAGRLFLTPSAQGQMPLRSRRRSGRPAQNRADDAGKVHDSAG